MGYFSRLAVDLLEEHEKMLAELDPEQYFSAADDELPFTNHDLAAIQHGQQHFLFREKQAEQAKNQTLYSQPVAHEQPKTYAIKKRPPKI